MWQSILCEPDCIAANGSLPLLILRLTDPPIFVKIIDTALIFLFSWHSKQISQDQKLAAYAHLYSFASVKSVVHWFQIMRTGTFQMYVRLFRWLCVMQPLTDLVRYDDDAQSLVGRSFYHPARVRISRFSFPVEVAYSYNAVSIVQHRCARRPTFRRERQSCQCRLYAQTASRTYKSYSRAQHSLFVSVDCYLPNEVITDEKLRAYRCNLGGPGACGCDSKGFSGAGRACYARKMRVVCFCGI